MIALLPGFGAAGIPGVVLIVTGIGLVWMQFGLRTGLTYASATVALTIAENRANPLHSICEHDNCARKADRHC